MDKVFSLLKDSGFIFSSEAAREPQATGSGLPVGGAGGQAGWLPTLSYFPGESQIPGRRDVNFNLPTSVDTSFSPSLLLLRIRQVVTAPSKRPVCLSWIFSSRLRLEGKGRQPYVRDRDRLAGAGRLASPWAGVSMRRMDSTAGTLELLTLCSLGPSSGPSAFGDIRWGG